MLRHAALLKAGGTEGFSPEHRMPSAFGTFFEAEALDSEIVASLQTLKYTSSYNQKVPGTV